MDVTLRIRYNAADRLTRHHKLSQWILALTSIELIIIPLLQAMQIPMRVNPQLLNAIEVSLAVLTLTYSLLLGMENYYGRAEKTLSCGKEITKLTRDVYPLLNQSHDAIKYKEMSDRYQDILDKYENHEPIDYEIYKINNPEKYYQNKVLYLLAWISVKIKYILNFWHYIVVSIGIAASILYIFVIS